MGSQSSGASFNEEAALEELERLQRAIAESRRQRGESVAEFDAFVRSFRDPALDARKQTSIPAPVNRTPSPTNPSALPPVGPPVAPAEQSGKADATPTSAVATPAGVRVRGRRLSVGTLIAGLAGIAAVIVAVVIMINRGSGSGSTASPATTAAPPVTTSPSPSIVQSSSANAAPATSQGPPPQAEIVTLRPVWLRVLVDGERTIEREVKGNERIPLRARRTIAIRAGDAGAVRMMLNGQDQGLLGRTGEVISRTFTVPGAAVPPAR
jgi:hypothetical protein